MELLIDCEGTFSDDFYNKFMPPNLNILESVSFCLKTSRFSFRLLLLTKPL